MRVYVGVTDGSWAHYLRSRPQLTEANFWRPRERHAFRALSIDGAQSHAALLAAIRGYRRERADQADPRIGCVLLRDITFFDTPESVPSDFSPNIVQGKSYDAEDLPPRSGLARSLFRLAHPGVYTHVDPLAEPPSPITTQAMATRRLGQQAFQVLVLAAYGRRCAVTGDRIRPVLQAAHIRPVAVGGQHQVDNGLLLRSDVHTLFDRGYLGVDRKYRLQISHRSAND